MVTALRTGLLYFAAVFGLAFMLGVARTLVIAPRIGALSAVLLELPLLVGASWVVARWLLRRRPLTRSQQAVMGATAFGLTMLAEMVLAQTLRGQDVAAWAAQVAAPLGLVGLAGQVAFGVMPLLVGTTGRSAKQAG
jgi:hypothetical protein